MQLQNITTIKSGQGKKGPWHLVKATFNGKEYTGFVYDTIPAVGSDLEVEFYQEEYNGQMQDKFKLLGKKAQESKVTEMAIKTAVEQMLQPIRMSLERIEAHLGTTPKPTIAHTNVPYPDGPVDTFTEEEQVEKIKPEDIPFN